MPLTTFRNRRAVSIENEHLRVTVMREGGHLAEVFDKQAGVSPLWQPPWPTMEPSQYNLQKHPEYGSDAESRLLAGIMGHNLCLDIFGPPTAEEEAAGLTVHGEASIAAYEFDESGSTLTAKALLSQSHLRFERSIALRGRCLIVRETVVNLLPWDRPTAWTQHVTLGPPYLARDTQLRASMTRSKVYESSLGPDMHFAEAAEFDWPLAPLSGGGAFDLRALRPAPPSSEYTAHLADPAQQHAWFVTWSPAYRLAFAYVWQRADFPWLGMWREDASRQTPPWNGNTMTLGMEFGASPMPENRRAQVDRGQLFGVPAYRWLKANASITTEYRVLTQRAEAIPESIDWQD